MHQKIVLSPGERYDGSFTVANNAASDEISYFATSVKPFYLDDDNGVIFEEHGSYNQIVDWITVEEKTGSVEPNNSTLVHYSIVVPEDAPAGGQYAVINVGSITKESVSDYGSFNIDITYGVGYMIYAEILGKTERKGEILSLDVPSFIFSGNLSASASVKNNGNVHGIASYTLQIYPLFSGEEVFTNEEEPATRIIIPEQTIYNETVWENTPPIGIFNVVYTVEFEGTTAQVKKLVIKCPIWLLFIIIFAIIAIIMYFFIRSKNRKNNKKRTQAAKAE